MTVYGTKITSDIDFSFNFCQRAETRYEIELSSRLPDALTNSIICGVPLFWSHGRNVYLYTDRANEGYAEGQAWCYEIQHVAKFYWYGADRIIYYRFEEQGSSELLGFWFIHQLLPMFMALENMFEFLHAGSVEIDGRAVVFMAPSSGGKSTLTDYFLQKGHRLVTDDKLATFVNNDRFMAVPSHPYHRPFRAFEIFGIRAENIVGAFRPIHVFYLLEKSVHDDEIIIEELNGYAKFASLIEHYLYSFTFLKLKRLGYLGKMSDSVRVFRVKRPWRLERQEEVYHAICNHNRSMV